MKPYETKLSVFEKKLKKQVLVLILDEVDMLFKEHGGMGETWFRTLIEWAESKVLRFSMIGISNCVNDDNAVRIREIGHVSSCSSLCLLVLQRTCSHSCMSIPCSLPVS